MSEGPQGDGRIGQAWYQPLLALVFGTSSIAFFVLFVFTVSLATKRDRTRRTYLLVRWAAAPWFAASAGLLVAALTRFASGVPEEAVVNVFLAALCLVPGLKLVRTRLTEFVEPPPTEAGSPYPRS